PQRQDPLDAPGYVMSIALVSMDGTLNLDLTESGQRLLDGANTQSPSISDDRMVFEFHALTVRRPGVFRIQAQMFSMLDSLTVVLHSAPLPAQAVFSGLSEPI
ncbi:hypothetical protein EC988_007860, partial [Linderina pennispora]